MHTSRDGVTVKFVQNRVHVLELYCTHPHTCVTSTLNSFCCSLMAHWLKSCWADWRAQAGSNRKAERGNSMKLKLLLQYSIHATYRRIQMTELLACPPCITPFVLFLQTAIWNPRAGLTLTWEPQRGSSNIYGLGGQKQSIGRPIGGGMLREIEKTPSRPQRFISSSAARDQY